MKKPLPREFSDFDAIVEPLSFRYIQLRVPCDLARFWLHPEINYGNRPLNPYHIARVTTAMMVADWPLMPVPICFSVSGRLMDGQHRLTGTVRSGKAQRFIISLDCPDELYPYFDIGRPRSIPDTMMDEGANTTNVAIVRVLGELVSLPWAGRFRPTNKAMVLGFKEFEIELAATEGGRRRDAPAPVRAGFVLAMKRLPEEAGELCRQFALYTSNDQEMWKQLWAIHRAVAEHRGDTHVRLNLMARTFHALVHNRDSKKLAPIDIDRTVEHLREFARLKAPEFAVEMIAECREYIAAAPPRRETTAPVVPVQEKLL